MSLNKLNKNWNKIYKNKVKFNLDKRYYQILNRKIGNF